jgi:hypothetical protein
VTTPPLMRVARATVAALARLRDDTRGDLIATTMSLAMSMFVVSGIFLLNTQLNKAYIQRDMVDHAAALAADAANKVLCANSSATGGDALGSTTGSRADTVRNAVQPLLNLVAAQDQCKIEYLQGDSPVSQVQPDQQLDVQVTCTIPCSVPFAAARMCNGSPPSLTYKAKQSIQPVGCDMKEQ